MSHVMSETLLDKRYYSSSPSFLAGIRHKILPFRRAKTSFTSNNRNSAPPSQRLKYQKSKQSHLRPVTKGTSCTLHISIHSAHGVSEMLSGKHGYRCTLALRDTNAVTASERFSLAPNYVVKKFLCKEKVNANVSTQCCKTSIQQHQKGLLSWKERFQFSLSDTCPQCIVVQLKSCTLFGLQTVGSCLVPITMDSASGVTDQWFDLQSHEQKVVRIRIMMHLIIAESPDLFYKKNATSIMNSKSVQCVTREKGMRENVLSPDSVEFRNEKLEAVGASSNSTMTFSPVLTLGTRTSEPGIGRRPSYDPKYSTETCQSAAHLLARCYADIMERESRNVLMDKDEISDEEELQDLLTRNNVLIEEEDDIIRMTGDMYIDSMIPVASDICESQSIDRIELPLSNDAFGVEEFASYDL
uniref:AlNc14C187G8358 protein n=1 Tax=Albugo laibachii Nc14 TaxID=890382 RepID=F0WPL3_9STRA|nr:AlNc14C187G8358 [Albugo laibachii Nc14]|eukprot:CCA23263.1 AlNc14C187G8358 [Albugo laibachii Nc14]